MAHPWALGYYMCVADTDTKSRLLRGTTAAPKRDGSLPNFYHYKKRPASSALYDPCLTHPATQQYIIIFGKPSMFSSRVTVVDRVPGMSPPVTRRLASDVSRQRCNLILKVRNIRRCKNLKIRNSVLICVKCSRCRTSSAQ